MAKILKDNTVIPSYLGVGRRGNAPGRKALLNDNVLRLGEIKKLIYHDDPLTYGKKTVEYEIEIQHRNESGIYVTTTWRGSTISTLFGGIADRLHYTLRADEQKDQDAQVGTGSKVLCLCLAGDQQKAIILGGVEDPTSDRKEEKDAGHNLFFEFNGIRFTINKDGELTLLFRGATQNSGELADKVDDKASGATVNIDKKGSITVKTMKGDDVEHQVVLNHDSGDIEIKTVGAWKHTNDKTFEVEAKKGHKLTSSDAGMEINVSKDVTVKTSGVKVGNADENWVIGKTWQQNRQTMNNSLNTYLQAIGTALQTASTSLQTAAGLNSTPYVGGGMAASAFIACSVALNLASQGATQAASAIQTFEQTDYLSGKHFGEK